MSVHTKTSPKTKKVIRIKVLAITGKVPFAEIKEYDYDLYTPHSTDTTYYIEEIKSKEMVFRAPANLVIREYIEKIIQ